MVHIDRSAARNRIPIDPRSIRRNTTGSSHTLSVSLLRGKLSHGLVAPVAHSKVNAVPVTLLRLRHNGRVSSGLPRDAGQNLINI